MQDIMAAHSDAAAVFRKNVKAEMEARRWSITDLAERAGMSRPGLSVILSGKEAVTIQRAERIAHALDVTLSALLRDTSPENKKRQSGKIHSLQT